MSTPDITVHHLGREKQPLVVIDNFAPDPDALRAAAVAARFSPAEHYYPGIRAPLPAGYISGQQPIIATIVADAFGQTGLAQVIDASFSMVTSEPAALSVTQRLPHCDAFAVERIALLHYLSPEGSDGTAFFRHRSTGFETVDQARAPIYFDQLSAEIRYGGEPPLAYVAGDTPLFERTMLVEARYNRALIYRSYLLHSGAISPGALLSPDPASGRLTITAFLSIEQEETR
ncbi:MAG: DUF6445 family protein [Candidatus Sphingomonas phytovorans]|nr:DUF6445 family protein [Sphingomonas sp.]WEK00124.1 MAG: DUF6445 family protein [Sphingomonas sp.]